MTSLNFPLARLSPLSAKWSQNGEEWGAGSHIPHNIWRCSSDRRKICAIHDGLLRLWAVTVVTWIESFEKVVHLRSTPLPKLPNY